MLTFITLFWFFLISICLWSFSSYLIYRLNKKLEKKDITNILKDRSRCPKCKSSLWYKDLFPIFSWILLKWKCRYCNEKISAIYPIMEIVYWISFMVILLIFYYNSYILNNFWVLIQDLFLNQMISNIFIFTFCFLTSIFSFIHLKKMNKNLIHLFIWLFIIYNLLYNIIVFHF